jgi:hypothetical protein
MIHKKMKKVGFILIVLSFVFASFMFVNAIDVTSFPSVCCEKTITGAFCINTKSSECVALPFRTAVSSCSQTSYCRQGTTQSDTYVPNVTVYNS